MRVYHFLRADMRSGSGSESPWRVGETRSLEEGEIIPCERGYHGSPTVYDALRYATGPVLCLRELGDDAIPHGSPVDKYASRTATLIAAVAVQERLIQWAADCAERVLSLFEDRYPDDDRPRKAIAAARTGQPTEGAVDAAWTAAWVDVGAVDVAWAAESAWAAARAAKAARAASWAAVRATDAVWATAGDVARDAEEVWQRQRLNELVLPLLSGSKP